MTFEYIKLNSTLSSTREWNYEIRTIQTSQVWLSLYLNSISIYIFK
jgi:hypothetical protein